MCEIKIGTSDVMTIISIRKNKPAILDSLRRRNFCFLSKFTPHGKIAAVFSQRNIVLFLPTLHQHYIRRQTYKYQRPVRSLLIIKHSIKNFIYAATALAFTCSITLRMPIQTVRSVNTSTTLPLSVKGDSCNTDRSFINPLCTIYSTI